MATVTGLTAERMQEIIDATIVSAAIDGSGHLILETSDGTFIDAGSALPALPTASTTVQGIVELATTAETTTGTDTARAVTPAGVKAATDVVNATISALHTVELKTTVSEATAASSYPVGFSFMKILSADSWSLNSSVGLVITKKYDDDRCVQEFWTASGGTQTAASWVRSHHSSGGGGGWTVWRTLQQKAPTRHILTSTNASWAVPTGAITLTFQINGGGGGGAGAGAASSGQHAKGGGGQAGGYTESHIAASSFGSTINIAIGAAGAGASAGANTGGTGGATTVDSTVVTAPGGIGGSSAGTSAASFSAPGGSGGTAGTGDVASVGAPGGYGYGSGTLGQGGYGASSRFGSGGLGGRNTSSGQSNAGSAATGYGAGGGGGSSASTGAAAAGGAGTAGLCVITVHY